LIGGNHFLAGFHFHQLRTGLADLMIERIAMALLDDHFVPRKIAYIRDVAHPRLKVFRHHAGISDDHGRGGAGRHQTGVARRGLTQFRDEFSGGDLEVIDQNAVLVAHANQFHHLGPHHRTTDHGERSIDVDDRRYAKLCVNVAGGTESGFDWQDGVAVDRASGWLGFLAEERRA